MTMIVILTLLVMNVYSSPNPMLCQTEKGARLYKIDSKQNCTSVQNSTAVIVKIDVPVYTERTVSGSWIGLYKATCETHFFFWGSYTTNTHKHPVLITPIQVPDLKRGFCPSSQYATPLIHHPDPVCVYTWPQMTTNEILYCIMHPTTIRISPNHPLTSDEEMFQEGGIHDTYAITVTGAIVVWSEAIVSNSPMPYKTRYKGPALMSITGEHTLVTIEDLQETITLKHKLSNEECDTWTSTEEYRIEVCPDKARQKRDLETAISSLREEILGKLNYQTYIMRRYVDRSQSICQKQNLLKSTLSMIMADQIDEYARSLLGTLYITASMHQDIIITWPCKEIKEWGYLYASISHECYSDIPIWYLFHSQNLTGYLNPRSYHITNTTSRLLCDNIKPVLSLLRGDTVLWNGQTIVKINTDMIHISLPNKEIGILPVWKDTWLYNISDFHQEERHHPSWRDMEIREGISDYSVQNSIYSTQMAIPFAGLFVVPSLLRCLEWAAYIGGLMYLWSSLQPYIRRIIVGKRTQDYMKTDPLNLM